MNTIRPDNEQLFPPVPFGADSQGVTWCANIGPTHRDWWLRRRDDVRVLQVERLDADDGERLLCFVPGRLAVLIVNDGDENRYDGSEFAVSTVRDICNRVMVSSLVDEKFPLT